MYGFIKSTDFTKNESQDTIDFFEKSWKIKFPNILRKYYMNCNFSKIKKNKGQYPVSMILPLRNNVTWSVDEFRTSILEGEFVYNTGDSYIPFAVFDDEFCYFWEKKTGKVFVYGSSRNSVLVEICDSVEDFFKNLEEDVESLTAKKKFSWFFLGGKLKK